MASVDKRRHSDAIGISEISSADLRFIGILANDINNIGVTNLAASYGQRLQSGTKIDYIDINIDITAIGGDWRSHNELASKVQAASAVEFAAWVNSEDGYKTFLHNRLETEHGQNFSVFISLIEKLKFAAPDINQVLAEAGIKPNSASRGK